MKVPVKRASLRRKHPTHVLTNPGFHDRALEAVAWASFFHELQRRAGASPFIQAAKTEKGQGAFLQRLSELAEQTLRNEDLGVLVVLHRQLGRAIKGRERDEDLYRPL